MACRQDPHLYVCHHEGLNGYVQAAYLNVSFLVVAGFCLRRRRYLGLRSSLINMRSVWSFGCFDGRWVCGGWCFDTGCFPYRRSIRVRYVGPAALLEGELVLSRGRLVARGRFFGRMRRVKPRAQISDTHAVEGFDVRSGGHLYAIHEVGAFQSVRGAWACYRRWGFVSNFAKIRRRTARLNACIPRTRGPPPEGRLSGLGGGLAPRSFASSVVLNS